jgi:hypothetical protein
VYNRLIKAAKTVETSPFLAEKILPSVHTGLRRGSLFHLRWEYVDFFNHRVAYSADQEWATTCDPLERHGNDDTTGPVYRTRARLSVCVRARGRSTRRAAIKDVKNGFHTALEIAQIKDFTWHDLRHTFASWLIMKGASLRSVAELLGHRGLRIVMRYAHLSSAYLSSEVGCWTSRQERRRRKGCAVGKGQEKGNVRRDAISRGRKSSNFRSDWRALQDSNLRPPGS